jgi:DNA-binding NtrC family response regulator
MSAHGVIEGLLLGDSLEIRRLRALIERVAPTNLPVLIEGPTGSGKELVARATHLASGRKGSFVPFNVCAIPDTMFEDALFGHVRGGFTGAVQDTQGYLTQADHGTAFFDEVGGLPLSAQVKLLRAIETREYRPVGARRDVRSDFRVVAATNESLESLQDGGAFREDLRHRFGKLVLRVPSLTERRQDVPRLAQHFLNECCEMAMQIAPRALATLVEYSWPGNVRELRTVIETAAILCDHSTINAADLLPLLQGPRQQVRLDFVLQRTLDVLAQVNGDVSAAAGILGVNKTTIYRRLRRNRPAAIQSLAATSLSRRYVNEVSHEDATFTH